MYIYNLLRAQNYWYQIGGKNFLQWLESSQLLPKQVVDVHSLSGC